LSIINRADRVRNLQGTLLRIGVADAATAGHGIES